MTNKRPRKGRTPTVEKRLADPDKLATRREASQIADYLIRKALKAQEEGVRRALQESEDRLTSLVELRAPVPWWRKAWQRVRRAA